MQRAKNSSRLRLPSEGVNSLSVEFCFCFFPFRTSVICSDSSLPAALNQYFFHSVKASTGQQGCLKPVVAIKYGRCFSRHAARLHVSSLLLSATGRVYASRQTMVALAGSAAMAHERVWSQNGMENVGCCLRDHLHLENSPKSFAELRVLHFALVRVLWMRSNPIQTRCP